MMTRTKISTKPKTNKKLTSIQIQTSVAFCYIYYNAYIKVGEPRTIKYHNCSNKGMVIKCICLTITNNRANK